VFTFVCSDWMDVDSVQEVFVAVAVVAFVAMFPTTIAMIVWGKRLRAWTTGRYEQFLRTRR